MMGSEGRGWACCDGADVERWTDAALRASVAAFMRRIKASLSIGVAIRPWFGIIIGNDRLTFCSRRTQLFWFQREGSSASLRLTFIRNVPCDDRKFLSAGQDFP